MIFKKRKLKLGLALGSGGAKGAAHLGAMAAMREAGFSFDIFAGTSIGSLVGALAAKGYDEKDMLSILSEMWQSKAYALLSVLDGGLLGVVRSVLGGADFSDLKRPFAAIATDLISGKEVVFTGGELSAAIASSCAMPPSFKPIDYGDMRLIDGAFTNYVPADRAIELGAGAVVSVNLGAERKTNAEGKRVVDDLYPGNKIALQDRSVAAYKYSAVVIEPDLSAYTGFSVNKIREMYEIGYDAASKKTEEIEKAIKSARVSKAEIAAIKDDGAIRIR